jgi:hypothetical protein
MLHRLTASCGSRSRPSAVNASWAVATDSSLVAERLADRLLWPVRTAGLRVDDPKPRRNPAGADARNLGAAQLGPSGS